MLNFMDAFGQSVLDYLNSDQSKEILLIVDRDDNYFNVGRVSSYFIDYGNFPKLEKQLLTNVHGQVLELDAGVGRVSLYLQNQGYQVTTTDISSGALKVCQNRGITNTQYLDINQMHKIDLNDTIDTVILFGNSLPATRSPQAMIDLLQQLYELTSPSEVFFSNFFSPVPTTKPYHFQYHKANREKGRRIGQIRLRVRYLNLVGEWFDFWLPTREEFIDVIHQNEWSVELLGEKKFYCILSK